MPKLHFSLVAPERELYAGEVDQVDAPGTDGDFGVLFGHAPLMTTLRPGAVVVRDGATRRVFTIQGGFADVTPESFTLLAEGAAEAAVQ
jgi:F-type H+-transporting ATPase subunit epsilon